MIADDIFEWLNEPTTRRSTQRVGDGFFLASDVGVTREENQDRVAILRVSSKNQTFWCACLCDGMGGLANGSQAAALAVSSFFSSLITNRREAPSKRLEIAAKEASNNVAREVPGGGATLSAILLEGITSHSLNIGDSRIFEVVNGAVTRLTVDDTMEEAYGAQGRGLLQFIGMKSGLVPHVKVLPAGTGTLVLTSDGAHSVGAEMLGALVAHTEDSEALGNRVLDIANWIGGKDNASLIVARPVLAQKIPVPHGSDISVWTTLGRMKIAWPSSPQAPSMTVRSETPEPSSLPAPEKPVLEEAIEPTPKPGGRKTGKRRRNKAAQIEIGFTEEDGN